MLDGHTLASVTRWMESKDPLGWNDAKICRVLVNPTTAGYRTNRQKVSGKRGPQIIHGPGTWEPIITPEMHDDLVAMFAARKSGPRGPESRQLLSGIATRGVCDGYLWWDKGGRKKDGTHYGVYACREHHTALNEETLNDVIRAVVEGILSSPESLAALAAPPTEPDGTAKTDLDELRRQLQAVEDQMIENKMPAEVGARVATRLAERIAEAEAALAPVFTDPVVRDLATAPDPVAAWKVLPLAQQRAFIRAVRTIRVERVGRGRWHAKEAGDIVTPRSVAPKVVDW